MDYGHKELDRDFTKFALKHVKLAIKGKKESDMTFARNFVDHDKFAQQIKDL
jgi:hypothetical protein